MLFHEVYTILYVNRLVSISCQFTIIERCEDNRMKISNLFNQSKEYLFFTLTTMISAGVHFAFSVYSKRIIPPFEYGIYSTCVILQTYMTYLQLGSMNAFNRDYPQLIGAKEHEKAEEYRNTIFSFLVLVFGVAIAIIAIITFCGLMINKDLDRKYSYGYLLSSAITALSVIESFGNSRSRIDGNFLYIGKVALLELLSVVVGIALLKYLGYYTLYLTTIVSMLIGIALYYQKCFSDIKLRVDKILLRHILISGLPLLINSLVWTLVNTVDKFVILGFIGTEALGVYGIAQNAFSFIVLIPIALSQIFYVKMGREYGANGNIQTLNEVSLRFTSVLAVISSFVAIGALFLIPPFVELILPKYQNGILSAQILIVGLAIYAPTLVNGNILTILKRNAALLRSSIYLCVFDAAFSTLFLFVFGKDISSVAYGTAVSYILRSVILVYQIKKYCSGNAKKLIMSSIVPVCISLFPSILIYVSIPNRLVGLILALLIASLTYIIMYRKELNRLLRNWSDKQ